VDVAVGVFAVEELHQAEVEDLDEVVIVLLPQQHDVRRLQVAVDDSSPCASRSERQICCATWDHTLLRERPVLLHRLESVRPSEYSMR